MLLERLGNSDALYHNAEHTMMVTLVGQQIIRGQLVTRAVQPEDWLHYMLPFWSMTSDTPATSVRGTRKPKSSSMRQVTGLCPPRGASDAFLAPYHIDRGKIYARQRFAKSSLIDEERIAHAIEYTRFPVPDDPAYAETTSEAALVRAADLIGQIADPFYHRKIGGLYSGVRRNRVCGKTWI